MTDYTIQSILAAVILEIPLDLKYLKEQLPWSIRQIQPHLLTSRFVSPKATIMIYKSGKIAIAGTKSFDEVDFIKKRVLDDLVKIGISVPINPPIVIWNIVGTADVGRPLDIESLSEQLYKNSVYMPEIFSGLIYRIPNSSLTVLAFSTGKLVLVGAKQTKDLQTLYNSFVELLER